MNINRKRALLQKLDKSSMPYFQMGIDYLEVQQLLSTGAISRESGPSGIYTITEQGQRWLNLQRQEVA